MKTIIERAEEFLSKSIGERGGVIVDYDLLRDLLAELKRLKPEPINADNFEDFWQAYPKKVGKGDARKSWAKIKPCSQLQQRMAASLEAQKQSIQWLKDGGKYIPNPSTWLNQQRWEDDLTPLPYKSEQELRREHRMKELF